MTQTNPYLAQSLNLQKITNNEFLTRGLDASTKTTLSEKLFGSKSSPTAGGVDTSPENDNLAKFLYPSLILIPLLIVAISILASSLSVFSKISLIILLFISMLFYFFSVKNIDIVSYFTSTFGGKKSTGQDAMTLEYTTPVKED